MQVTPSPSPVSVAVSAATSIMTNIASSLQSISNIVSLPSWVKIVAFAVSAIGGSVAVYLLGRYLTGWFNEVGNIENDASATEGRTKSDQSDQDLNNQSSTLPKD